MKDFRDFLLRGNLVDMAVGIVIGLAFSALVTALIQDMITPLIGAIGGTAYFSGLTFTIHNSHFFYGAFIDAALVFLVIAAVVFFLVIKPVNKLMAMRRTEPDVAATTQPCPECLSQIPVGARRCAFCTAVIGAG